LKDDVIVNKLASIERCLKRIHEEYRGHEDELHNNFSRQDAIVLNLLRLCEIAIDLASYTVRSDQLGSPQSTREVFVLLEQAEIIDKDLSTRLQAMVGFRNVAVHEYQKLSLPIVVSLLQNHLNDFVVLSQIFIKKMSASK
jgi:uncharacterized protein YutE (UPF0331/DUF86 family)